MLCGYCTGADAKHIWKFAWFLRRHVQSVHIDSGEFGAVKLAPGWYASSFSQSSSVD